MRVLYVSHTSEVSGAEHCLLDLLAGLPETVSASVACPAGTLSDRLHRLGVPVAPIRELRLGLRTPASAAMAVLPHLAAGAVAIRRLAHRTRIDLLHANSVRAGLMAGLAAAWGGPPAVVHVHDCLPVTPMADLVRRLIGRSAAAVLVNSRYTAANFAGRGCRAPIRVVYNVVDLDRFDASRAERAMARTMLGVNEETPLLGVVGQLTPWKAQDDALRTLAQVRANGYPTARLLLVGGTLFTAPSARYDNAAYLRVLQGLVRDLGLEAAVDFLGERTDVPDILSALDVALVPSWEEPFGRAVVEAMAMRCAVVATNVGGPSEIITHGEDGLLLPPRQPRQWANAVLSLLGNDDLRAAMGERASRRVSAAFSRRRYVEAVLSEYRSTLERTNQMEAVA
jgi:L-malate glycosyltransferase